MTSASTDAGRSAPPRLRDGLKYCVLVFLAVRIGLSVLSVASADLIEPRPVAQRPTVPGWPLGPVTPGLQNVVTATERQDAARYLAIATRGYRTDDASAAFFPLYPLAIRAVAWLPGVGPLGAALLVSNLVFAVALVLLYGLSMLEFGSETVAKRSVLFIAIFPTAFFFMAPYSESMLLLLSVAAFWCARRERWAWAALAAVLAALTRSVGILLAPALAVEALHAWRARGRPALPGLAAAAATLLGPLAYFGYWQWSHGDFWAPLHAQQTWQRVAAFPWTTIGDALSAAARLGSYWLVDVLVVGVVVLAVVAGWRMLRPSYVVYAGLSLLLPLCAPLPARPLLSMPRFVVVIFPAFWVYARAVDRWRLPEALVTTAFAGGYALLGALFINWWHIF